MAQSPPSSSVGLIVQNCVCKSTVNKAFPGAHVATIMSGAFRVEKHSSPSAITLSEPIPASLRIFPCKSDPAKEEKRSNVKKRSSARGNGTGEHKMKINVAGVRSYQANCVVTWLVARFLSQRLHCALYPIEIKCTNLMVTGYLDMHLDLNALHRHPTVARSSLYVPALISCLRLQVKQNSRMSLSIFPAGTMVMTGPSSLAVAYDALAQWLPIIKQFGTVPVDQIEHRRQQAAEQRQFIDQMKQVAKAHAIKGVVHPTPLTRRTRTSVS